MRKVRALSVVLVLSMFLNAGCGSAVIAALLLLRPEKQKDETPTQSLNTPPSVIILPISGTQTGDVTVTYYLSDADSNPANITVEFSADEGASYTPVTEETASGLSEGTTNLATSPSGIPHVFIWDSDADLPGVVNENILVRITPSDIDGTGTPAQISIGLDNNQPPTVSVTTPSSPASGSVSISYTLTDAESDICSIMVHYSTDGGITFESATEGSGGDGTTGLTSSDTGVTHTYIWNSFADLGYTNYIGVIIRITPSDIKTGALDITDPFNVNNNEAPIAQVDTPTTVQSGDVFITYTLFDSNSDPVDIEIEWWDPFDATPQWKPATEVPGAPSEGTTGLTSSPGGTSHIFVWDSLTDMGAKYSDRIKIRIRPRDALVVGSWAGSDSFEVSNNEAPTAMAQTPSGVQQSNVLITYYLSDAESDTCDITVYFSDDGGVNWYPATEVPGGGGGDGTTNLTSSPSPGTSHTFDWDAQTDLAGRYETDVQIKIVPSDIYREGIPYPTSDFTVDATTPPSVSNINPPGGTSSGDVPIEYTLTDAESQDCSILVEYKKDGGLNWYTATEGSGGDGTTGLTSSPTGVSHTFVWDTVADNIGPTAPATVRIRITPTDTKTGATAESTDFNVDNSLASEKPWIVIYTPSSPQSGTFDITYDLNDNQGDNCDIEVQFSTDGGASWNTCTGSPILNEPTGAGKTFSWDSVADIGAVYDEDVKIRMRPTDIPGGNVGNWAVTENFTVDNNAAPSVEVTTPTGTQSGDVTIDYTLFDAEGDTCSIFVEYSDDGGNNWYPATEGTGGDGTTGLDSSSGGTTHTYVWNSEADIGATSQDDIRIRITPNDGYRDGTSGSTNNFTVNNIVTVTWTGDVDDNWDVEGNWNGGVPTSASSVTIPSGRPHYPRLTYSTRIHSLTLMSGASLTLKGDITLAVTDDATIDGTLTMDSTWTNTTLAVEGDLTLTGLITADGKGYASGSGFAPGWSGDEGAGGGGHGGYGGWGEGWSPPGGPYDSVVEPSLPGSGGGSGNYGDSPGGKGGGAIRIVVSGTFTLTGSVTANGDDGINGGGGGAGGSILIECNILTGDGSFNADGGDGTGSPQGGGGGGGKIAIHYNDISEYTGRASCTVAGGTGYYDYHYMYGSIVFIDKNSTDGRADDDLYIYHDTHLNETSYTFHNVTITNNAEVAFDSYAADNLLCPQITLEATNDFTIDAGCVLTANGLGYPGSEGPGAGSDDPQGNGTGGHGGGHGGFGGRGDNNQSNPVGAPYGDFLNPTTSGSGGGHGDYWWGGGSGGGAIRIIAGDTLTLNGEIHADGYDAGNLDAAGGAGGSVWVTCNILTGSGFCTANGGDGSDDGGGGAGGRVAIHYNDDTSYTAHTSCTANGGAEGSGVDANPYGNGNCGSCLFVDTKGTSDPADDEIHIYNDCRITQEDLICARLELHNNATFFIDSHAAGDKQVLIRIDGDCIIPPECAINADGLGYIHAQGPGAGESDRDGAGGAGYGGAGGDGDGGNGGGTYGDPTAPTHCGSGGGDRDSNRWGGAGGGSIKLVVSGTLTINGSVKANGEDAWWQRGGGGAGGSVWIECGTLSGSGFISANGGDGKGWNRGGGGAGGRIKITALNSTWTGIIGAVGGIGPGSAGEGENGTVEGP